MTLRAGRPEATPDEDLCGWCEAEPATITGYDEHNGPVRWCDECHADAVHVAELFDRLTEDC